MNNPFVDISEQLTDLQAALGKITEICSGADDLVNTWANPSTRKFLLEQLHHLGFGTEKLLHAQKTINAEDSDWLDVLIFILYARQPISRATRVKKAEKAIFNHLNPQQKEFISFVLDRYIANGCQELSQDNLPELLEEKYYTILHASTILEGVPQIVELFFSFQRHLYTNTTM